MLIKGVNNVNLFMDIILLLIIQLNVQSLIILNLKISHLIKLI